MKLAAGGGEAGVSQVRVRGGRPTPSALSGMKAEDSELLGTAELIRGTDDLQQNPGPDQSPPLPPVRS